MEYFLIVVQLAATVIMSVFFFTQLRRQQKNAPAASRECQREMDELYRLKQISLTRPLAESVRPQTFEDIVGQEDGIRSLKAILCGSNPQHVIIYGPPGIGKTCAARLVMEYAKHSAGTPFRKDAPFIEMDATCVRFDERAIADPLIGSVHDPIYQGAGPLGVQGIPQPKAGAVTRAHGGVLFLDEIGELHPIQMNKLLKVLEDRKVMFESAYYRSDDAGTPRYVHDVFKNGMPADFRLIGATTRSPQDISPALRSRCMEIFFRPLENGEIAKIAVGSAKKAGYALFEAEARQIGDYAACGRDAVNIVQMCAGLAQMRREKQITTADVSWVIASGRYPQRSLPPISLESRVGCVHGLAVMGMGQGGVLELEGVCRKGTGRVEISGIVEEEELRSASGCSRRKSMARASVDNVVSLLRAMDYPVDGFDMHINFPGGVPVDGPSAGAAIAVLLISLMTGRAVDGLCAVTGEISVRGRVLPVGGVPAKVEAAAKAGLKRAIVPKGNAQEAMRSAGIEVLPVETLEEVIIAMLLPASIESGASLEERKELTAL